MPLKYLLHQPMAVKICGWIHGILFVAFLFLAWEVKTDRNKSLNGLQPHFLQPLSQQELFSLIKN
jgi:integral membrane protein